eukprot:CAMPEP_0172156956 /NCGR_PEP_ID=MMETSP1050-20130122/3518_1 /TAXON_ID=233186 /ORGANISM="Cryptomonas curvata, Strain CCAP979/52" /LENGTH=129 /DNA_ID=CAMNT_0012826121 /DNA_START=161 /DNA_END=548 /DNA_ORIENTATION=+
MPSRSLASDAKAEIRDFDPILAKKMIHEDDGILIDCRTPQEFQSGAPPTAVLFPYDQIPARIDEIHALTGNDFDKSIVVYCKSGGRSAVAKQTLQLAGYRRVSNLGGIAQALEASRGDAAGPHARLPPT